MDWGAIVGAGAVSGIMNTLVWLTLRRSIEQTDGALAETRGRLHQMETERMGAVEKNLAGMVPKADCEREHARLGGELQKGSQRMYDTALRLEQVTTETKRLIEWVGAVSRQQVAVKEDLDRMLGELHAARGRT